MPNFADFYLKIPKFPHARLLGILGILYTNTNTNTKNGKIPSFLYHSKKYQELVAPLHTNKQHNVGARARAQGLMETLLLPVNVTSVC